jgi:hypothetical protein
MFEIYVIHHAYIGAIGVKNWRESLIVCVFFKHEDDGTAPQFALRLMQVVGAPRMRPEGATLERPV